MSYLILIRHGDHGLMSGDIFAGWIDTPLSDKGIREAIKCSIELENIELDIAFVSNLVRAQETLFILLSRQKKTGFFVHERSEDGEDSERIKWYSYPENLNKKIIPIYSTTSLNERFYGKLQGKKKQQMEEKYGVENFALWRLDFEASPPEGESLKDVYERVVPYFKQKILPAVRIGKNVLVCAHQSSLRALVKFIEDISDEDIKKVNFSTGQLVIYSFLEGMLMREG
jgi:2,3-bisphosphoglycerate-dependent phosphoglycerate mutase